MNHFEKLIITFISIFLVIILCIPTSADMSNFLDRTMDQLKGLNLKAYQGQERGYLIGGSASVRFDQYEQPLVSFTSPSLKIGCSGIDIVMGGFSYLNFEYLVQKFQQILSAAPAFAFQIALKTLCESCSDALNSLDSLVNQINNLNVNSCQAAKAIGAWSGQKLAEAIGNDNKEGGSNSWFSSLSKAIDNFGDTYKKWITDYAGAYDCYTLAGNARSTCLKNQGKVSFLTPLMKSAFQDMSFSFEFEPIFRAYFGDIYEDPNSIGNDRASNLIVDPGCFPGQSTDNILEAIVEGRYMEKHQNTPDFITASCIDHNLLPTKKGLKHQIQDDLTAILNAIRTNTPLNAGQINLVNASSIPIYRLFSLAILVERLGGDTSNILTTGMIETIAEPLAYDIAHQVLLRIYSIANAKLHAAMVSKEMPEAATMIKPIIDRINLQVSLAGEITARKWQNFKDIKFGEAVRKEAEFLGFIYQALAKNKLLESYLFAKGIR